MNTSHIMSLILNNYLCILLRAQHFLKTLMKALSKLKDGWYNSSGLGQVEGET